MPQGGLDAATTARANAHDGNGTKPAGGSERRTLFA